MTLPAEFVGAGNNVYAEWTSSVLKHYKCASLSAINFTTDFQTTHYESKQIGKRNSTGVRDQLPCFVIIAITSMNDEANIYTAVPSTLILILCWL